jgi:hypothetical protein
MRVTLVRSTDGGQGPNELSVTDKDMLPYILGSQGMPKGPSKIHKYGYRASFLISVPISIRGEANDSSQQQGYRTSQLDQYARLAAPCSITEGLEQSFCKRSSEGLRGADASACSPAD